MTDKKENMQPSAPDAVSIRGTIFSSKNKKRASRFVVFFGAEIELRQPSVADVVALSETESQQAGVIQTLINYAYVPGTDTKVFEEIHVNELMALPFDANFIRVSEAVKALTDISVGEVKKG